MTVAVRGRVPRNPKGTFTEEIATHIQERLQALERALAGSAPTFVSAVKPPPGPIVAPGGGGGSGGGGGGTVVGVTDHGALTGLADDDHPQYVESADPVKPHSHGPFDVVGLEQRFPVRLERTPSLPHPHGVTEIVGIESEYVRRGEHVAPRAHTHTESDVLGSDEPRFMLQRTPAHAHSIKDVGDYDITDAEAILAQRIFGG